MEQTIRPLHPLVSRILKEGRELSPTFAALSERVAASRSVIVYVDVRMESTDSGLNGALHFMASGSGHGFLRIDLHTGSTNWPSDIRALIIVLAHELWHASEVASHDVTTQEGFRRLYQSIGTETHRDVFETPEARAVGEAVRREIYGIDRAGRSGEWSLSPARPRM